MLLLRVRGGQARDPGIRPGPIPGALEVRGPLIPDSIGRHCCERSRQFRSSGRQRTKQCEFAAKLCYQFKVDSLEKSLCRSNLEQTYLHLGTILSLCSVYYPNIR